ncbi:MAG: MiaB/RimO family radical SAM methylthiotransferase [Candidatus Dormibacteraeota bacterium]|nr:MiaB/RimO family radical SAM methylthiotransferase [Candidatus Dormibacteraeota bacterium]
MKGAVTPGARFLPLPLAEARPHREPMAVSGEEAPRVHIWQIGCQMNSADADSLAEGFSEIGLRPGAALEDADLAVLVTCAVRQHAEDKASGKLGELASWKQARAGRAIALTGCMVGEHGGDLLKRFRHLDYVFDMRDPDGFFARVRDLYQGAVQGPIPLPASDRLLAYLPVILGCNEMCTYCIVPFVRGRETSRPMDEVAADALRMVARGVVEITLLGQNVNSYQDPDSGGGLPELMARVDRTPGLKRLRFLTSHPRNASADLLAAMAELPTACEHLHLPVQSGSDSCLRRMKREYSVAEYLRTLAAARRRVPNISLSTDIIVGFCGETDGEFEETLTMLRDVEFDTVHIQAYSPRPGTAAFRRADDVPRPIKSRRLQRVLELQRGISLRRNQALVGRRVEVLIEGQGADGRVYGRTRQNRIVWSNRPADPGTVVDLEVTAATAWQLTAG